MPLLLSANATRQVAVSNVVKTFPKVWGRLSALTGSNKTMPGTSISISDSRGQASRFAGRGVLKQRRLHFLTQYLHLEGHGKTPGNAVKEAASIAEIGAVKAQVRAGHPGLERLCSAGQSRVTRVD